MTRLFPVLLLLLGMLLPLRAQLINENRQYFDYAWKPCEENVSSFYRVVDQRNDTMWHIGDHFRFAGIQMRGFAKRSDGTGRFGTWTWFHANGRRSRVRNYVDDVQQGTSTGWHKNGQRYDSTFYLNGKIEGTSLKWHTNGMRSDSTFYLNGKIEGISLDWHTNGQLRSRGSYDNGKPVGIHMQWYDDGTVEGESNDRSGSATSTWTWYDRTGRRTAVESYENGKTINPIYYEPDGTTHSDTARAESFGEGEEPNTSYVRLARSITYPKLERNNNLEGAVLLLFQVKEDGSVANIEIEVPATPGMNDEAVRAIQIPGLFNPPKLHNKPWSYSMTLPVRFSLTSD